MIIIPLLFFAALYVAFLAWAVRKQQTWPIRIVLMLVLLSPVIYWVGSYQYVQYTHKQDCAREGGLKVLIRPEKANRVQLITDSNGEYSAEFLLKKLYPRLLVVEAWGGNYTGKGQKTGYFAYTLDPATTSLPEKDWKIIKSPLAAPTDGLYILSESSQLVNEINRTITTLSRNDQVIATWTMFDHYWSRNSLMNINWRCYYPDKNTKNSRWTLSELIL